MNAFMLLMFAAAGVKSLLMPASPVGVTTSFAVAGNEDAIFYNPSNLRARDNITFQFSYNRFYLGMQSASLSVAKQVKKIDLGLGIVNFDYGAIEWRPEYPTEDTLSLIDYRAYDFSLILGAAVNMSDRGRIGLNVKYVSENIYVYSDYALAVDIAFAYQTPTAGITFGAANFGTKMLINNDEINLPARLSFGAFQLVRQFTLSGDLHYLVNESAVEFGIGASVPLYERLTLSAAANYRDEFYPGFGLAVAAGALEVKYGGAFYPRDLGMVNNLAITLALR